MIMKKILSLIIIATFTLAGSAKKELWPDGSAMDSFFSNTSKVEIKSLGKQYVITDYGVRNDSSLLQTAEIQAA